MAIPIRGIPVLEGDLARRFIREAKANEKKRGIDKFSEEDKAAFQAYLEKAKKQGTFPYL
jgi:2-oxo-4-hydroxy-4-carboxy--5-ureidoimidazoline (OHCU) decarboxylase